MVLTTAVSKRLGKTLPRLKVTIGDHLEGMLNGSTPGVLPGGAQRNLQLDQTKTEEIAAAVERMATPGPSLGSNWGPK